MDGDRTAGVTSRGAVGGGERVASGGVCVLHRWSTNPSSDVIGSLAVGLAPCHQNGNRCVGRGP